MTEIENLVSRATAAVILAGAALVATGCCGGRGQPPAERAAEPPPPVRAPAPAPAVATPAPPAAPTDGPACTVAALLPVVRGSESVAEGLEFELDELRCTGGFARALLRPVGDGDAALALFRAADEGWSLLDLGTGLECPMAEVPDELCPELVGAAGAARAP